MMPWTLSTPVRFSVFLALFEKDKIPLDRWVEYRPAML